MRCRLIRRRPRRSCGARSRSHRWPTAERSRPGAPRATERVTGRPPPGVRAVRCRADAPRCRGGADNVFRGVIAYGVAWCDNGGEAHRQERNAVHLRGRHLGRRDVRRCRVHADDHDRRYTHPVGGGVADDRSRHHHCRHGGGRNSGATSLTVALGITTAGKVEAKAATTSTYALARTTSSYVTARAASTSTYTLSRTTVGTRYTTGSTSLTTALSATTVGKVGAFSTLSVPVTFGITTAGSAEGEKFGATIAQRHRGHHDRRPRRSKGSDLGHLGARDHHSGNTRHVRGCVVAGRVRCHNGGCADNVRDDRHPIGVHRHHRRSGIGCHLRGVRVHDQRGNQQQRQGGGEGGRVATDRAQPHDSGIADTVGSTTLTETLTVVTAGSSARPGAVSLTVGFGTTTSGRVSALGTVSFPITFARNIRGSSPELLQATLAGWIATAVTGHTGGGVQGGIRNNAPVTGRIGHSKTGSIA